MSEEHRRSVIRTKVARMPDKVQRRSLSTGFATLDAALEIGGFPRGEIVECFGPAGCGKTTLALQIAATVQREGGGAAWIDAERVFDPAYAAGLGVQVDKMPLARGESAEESLAIGCRLLESRAIDLLVVDSAAALVPRAELEMGLGNGGAGLQSRVLASGLRPLRTAARRADAVALFLNQKRFRPDARPGEADTSAGGSALKLNAWVRLALSHEGGRLRIRTLKNKAGGAFREAWLDWRAGRGFVKCP